MSGEPQTCLRITAIRPREFDAVMRCLVSMGSPWFSEATHGAECGCANREGAVQIDACNCAEIDAVARRLLAENRPATGSLGRAGARSASPPSAPAARLAELEELARSVGQIVGAVCDEREAGFALLMFDYGEGGWSTYISNAARADMVAALRETADRIERGLVADAGVGGRLPS